MALLRVPLYGVSHESEAIVTNAGRSDLEDKNPPEQIENLLRQVYLAVTGEGLALQVFIEGGQKWISRLEHSNLIPNQAPGLIRIERAHRGCRLSRGLAQVLLKQDSILVDDESHDSRIGVISRISNKCKSPHHLSIGDVVFCAARSIAGLLRENAEKIAMERHVRILLYGISVCGCEGCQRPQRALGLSCGRDPVQAVLFSRITDEFLREFLRCAISRLRHVLVLRIHQRHADVHDSEFITPDSTPQNLFFAGSCVKKPLASGSLPQRNRKWKIIGSDQQDLRPVGHLPPAMHHAIPLDERVSRSLVLNGIA